MTPNIGDLIHTKDLWIDGKYETIGVFMGFDESLNHGKITYKKMNILLDSGLTFVFVNTTEEQLCVEVLCQAVTGGSDEKYKRWTVLRERGEVIDEMESLMDLVSR